MRRLILAACAFTLGAAPARPGLNGDAISAKRFGKDAPCYAVYGRFLVDGDRAEATRHLSAMRHVFGAWDKRFDASKGLY